MHNSITYLSIFWHTNCLFFCTLSQLQAAKTRNYAFFNVFLFTSTHGDSTKLLHKKNQLGNRHDFSYIILRIFISSIMHISITYLSIFWSTKCLFFCTLSQLQAAKTRNYAFFNVFLFTSTHGDSTKLLHKKNQLGNRHDFSYIILRIFISSIMHISITYLSIFWSTKCLFFAPFRSCRLLNRKKHVF